MATRHDTYTTRKPDICEVGYEIPLLEMLDDDADAELLEVAAHWHDRESASLLN